MEPDKILELLMSKMDKIEDKVDKIAINTARQDVTLQNQHISLEEHIRRTNALEEIVKKLVKHTNWVEGVFKALGLIALISGVAVSLLKLLW